MIEVSPETIRIKSGNQALPCTYVLVLRITALVKYQSPNRADSDALATVLTVGLIHGLISKGAHHSVEAPVGKADGSLAQLFLAYPNASATENAFVRIINEQGTARVYG